MTTTLLIASLFASAAEPVAGSAPSWPEAWSLLTRQDRPLAGIAMMELLVAKKQLAAQTLASFYAITGDERGTNALLDDGDDVDDSPPTDTSGFVPQNAISAIVSAARQRRVVILNEPHHSQRARAFAHELSIRLRKEGFTHLCAETFAPNVAANMKDGAPTAKTGVYTLDPVFADWVRQTVGMGYQLCDYEQRPDQVLPGKPDRTARLSAREQAQADNLAKILDADPRARVLIYAGGSHASKNPDQNGVAWMALRLKQKTGVDPLTINQTAGLPRGRAELDGPLYRGVFKNMPAENPVVMQSKAGHWLTQPGFDMVVFHPRLADVAGRPGWLGMNGYRVSYPLKLVANSAKTLVRAFVSSEPAGAIAMDQVLVAPMQTSINLMLPPGQYVVVRQSESGDSTPVDQISVPLNTHCLLPTTSRQ